jgi:imidazolonepropionase-like amidohydrolase
MRPACATAVATLWLSAAPLVHASGFVVTGVRVFDGERVLSATSVAVDDGVIRYVGDDPSSFEHLPQIDGKGRTLLPGLIDAHVHVSGTEDLRQALRFGVTTELDMAAIGVFPKALAAMRARANASPDLADLRSAGFPATSPTGHGTEYGAPIPRLSADGDAADFVAKRKAEGSEYLKIMLNGVRSFRSSATNLEVAQVKELVVAAHAQGLLAVAHVETLRDAETALAGGVDGLAHSWRQGEPSRDVARRLAEGKVFVVATLVVPDGFLRDSRAALLADPRFQDAITEPIRQHLGRDIASPVPPAIGQRASMDLHLARVRVLHEAGVKLVAGSDAGARQPTAHGIGLHREIELLASAGMTPVEVLAAATANAADAFRLQDRGRVAPGLRADLVLVNGDPTVDLLAVRDIAKVWKAGVEADRAAR